MILEEQVNKEGVKRSVIDICGDLNLNYLGCQALAGGTMGSVNKLPIKLGTRPSNSRHLQLIKSMRQKAFLGYAVGMHEVAHIEDNLYVLSLPNSDTELVDSILDIPTLKR